MRRLGLLCIAAGLGTLLAGCQVRDDDPYAVRVRQLEQRLDQLNQKSANQGIGLDQRVNTLQEQVKQMQGDIEVLQHSSDLSTKQQRDLYQDLDKRLQKLEQGLSTTQAPSAATFEPPPATTAAATPGGGIDDAVYQKDFNLLKQGRFSEAIKGFRAFQKQYPDSPLQPNAVFWTGEAYYQTGDFETALATFRKVVKQYPKSNKVADATLKVGYCQYELQQWQSARQTLNSVVQDFPNTSAAGLATQRLQRMQDEGH
ncbi:MAG TPA: tol-pal system protein YbgF [Gammaproteobacteria bacterium]|jgi:tol-pal system protein YbgF|nr:tol-pal system protein YbgF [Gammaproteobacteria bacterium]